MEFWRRAISTAVVGTVWAVTAMAQPAAREATAAAGVRIEGFDVEEVPNLAPGARLAFTMLGTPGSDAQVRIEGAAATLRLHETQPGIYDGIYTVGPRERLDPSATVMGSLRQGDQVARARLEEPLVLGMAAPSDMPGVAMGPASGDEAVVVPEPRAAVAPPEDDAGRVSPYPTEVPRSAPRSVLPAPFSQPRLPPPAAPSRRTACADCAVVESVQAMRPEPRVGVVGAVIGGVTGALLGDRIAGRAERHWARLAGAIGGALAGRAIERNASGPVRYDVWLRLPDGTRQVRSYPNPPPYRAGDVVRLPAVALVTSVRPAYRD
jgi:outer membrane lipoprotein SlyB